MLPEIATADIDKPALKGEYSSAVRQWQRELDTARDLQGITGNQIPDDFVQGQVCDINRHAPPPLNPADLSVTCRLRRE